MMKGLLVAGLASLPIYVGLVWLIGWLWTAVIVLGCAIAVLFLARNAPIDPRDQ